MWLRAAGAYRVNTEFALQGPVTHTAVSPLSRASFDYVLMGGGGHASEIIQLMLEDFVVI